MNNSDKKSREIAFIAVGVATLIAGGGVIFIISSVFPLPGVKYILMSPYLSMVIYVIQSKIPVKFTLLKMGIVFALIMTVINLFMGITIIITTLLTQMSITFIKRFDKKTFWGSVLFSTYTGLCALTISKYIIGGIYREISSMWFLLIGLVCLVFGILGTLLAKKVLRYLRTYSFEQ